MKRGIKSIQDFREKDAEELYPDFSIWRRIPLNRILERFKLKDTTRPENALEAACREELSEYLWSVLKSIERNRYVYVPAFDDETHAELLKYFWDARRLPSPRSIIEFYAERRRPLDLEAAIFSE